MRTPALASHEWLVGGSQLQTRMHALYPTDDWSSWLHNPSSVHLTVCGARLVLREPAGTEAMTAERCATCCDSLLVRKGRGLPKL